MYHLYSHAILDVITLKTLAYLYTHEQVKKAFPADLLYHLDQVLV